MSRSWAVKKQSISSFLMTMILVDLLFFPKVIFSTPTMLLIYVVAYFSLGISRARFSLVFFAAIISLLSVLYGEVFFAKYTVVEDLKRVVQLIILLSLFSLNNISMILSVSRVLFISKVFVVYVMLWFALFVNDTSLYANLLTQVYPEAVEMLLINIEVFRFSLYFTDPNTLAYLLCLVMMVIFTYDKKDVSKNIFSIMLLIMIIFTQSRGGIILALMLILWFNLSPFSKRSGVYSKMVFLVLFLAIYYVFYVELENIYYLIDSRIESESSSGAGVGGGRVGKYLFLLSEPNLLPFGSGYALFYSGAVFRPHSDLIRIIFSYGFVVLGIVLYFVAPRRIAQLPAFLCFLFPFLINTIIDDYRLFGVFILFFSLVSNRGVSMSNVPVKIQ